LVIDTIEEKNMKNKDLKKKYDQIYNSGAYENYFTFNMYASEKLIIDALDSWNGLEVLDVGCGEGNLAAMLSFAGAKEVTGVDFSENAINLAKDRINIENVNFLCSDYKEINKKYDVIVMNGTFEHFDNPWDELDFMNSNILNKNGYIITSSPSFLNPRGYVWMTLQLLFDVPMSLTDLHFLSPPDFIKYANDKKLSLDYFSCDQDWGAGKRTIIDFRKRLTNALRDANLDNKNVEKLLEWLGKAIPFYEINENTGAMITYKLGPYK